MSRIRKTKEQQEVASEVKRITEAFAPSPSPPSPEAAPKNEKPSKPSKPFDAVKAVNTVNAVKEVNTVKAGKAGKAGKSVQAFQAFQRCAIEHHAERMAQGLDKTTEDGKMTDEEVKGLALYLTDGQHGISPVVADILTYKACEVASRVLCRWPRPSELARILAIFGFDKVSYACLKVGVILAGEADGDPERKWGRLIGSGGKNLVAMTQRHDLLYVWMHSQGRRATLLLYGADPATVLAGLEKIKVELNQNEHRYVIEFSEDYDLEIRGLGMGGAPMGGAPP